ncbi:hypothetical protein BDR07DRAFT_1377115 [Suillus spraguei]|nr:hypothetical protein BDR07DRAFT_1377115 [Suillus spraguei]
MSEYNQPRDSRQNPPETQASSEATTGESSGRRGGKIGRILSFLEHNTCNHTEALEGFPVRDPIFLNVDHKGVSSIKVQDAATGAEQGADPQSALQTTKEAAKRMKLLSGHVASGASAAQNASADLEAAYDFQDTYLQPLRIFDTVIGKLADVHPYAKMALSVLSWAAKRIAIQRYSAFSGS